MRLDKYIYCICDDVLGCFKLGKKLGRTYIHVLILRVGADVISPNLGGVSDRTCAWIFGIVMGPRTMCTTPFLLGE